MDGITIRAKYELEREKNYTPNEVLDFLRNKDNFRFVSNGIMRELEKRGKNIKAEMLRNFRSMMEEKGLRPKNRREELRWLADITLPSKEYAIKMCFAFELSSKTSPTTAREFLFNVCRINGFNYRVADDIIYEYALEQNKPYNYAKDLCEKYKKATSNLNFYLGDETKHTQTLWNVFENLSKLKEQDFLNLMQENAKNFIGYNKTAHEEFVKLHNSLENEYKKEIRDYNDDRITYGLSEDIYKGDVNIYDEIVYDLFLQSLVANKKTNPKPIPKTVLDDVLQKFPTGEHIKQMKTASSPEKATDLGHGFARKAFILCFFINHILIWRKSWNKDDYQTPGDFFTNFYDVLNNMLQRCSYGAIYPANPFDWLILNAVKSLDENNKDESIDPEELFIETISLLAKEGISEEGDL